MKDLLSYILENILTDEEKFRVEEEATDGNILLTIHLQPESMGKVIGKGGKTINAIKNILKIKAIKDQVRVEVEVLEEEAPTA
jgi:uncharacterized protein